MFRIILVQGLNRQIRRMCEYFGYDVVKLERVRIMNVKLKGLPPGEWRELTPDELSEIFKLIENSKGEDKKSESKKPAAKKNPPPASGNKGHGHAKKSFGSNRNSGAKKPGKFKRRSGR